MLIELFNKPISNIDFISKPPSLFCNTKYFQYFAGPLKGFSNEKSQFKFHFLAHILLFENFFEQITSITAPILLMCFPQKWMHFLRIFSKPQKWRFGAPTLMVSCWKGDDERVETPLASATLFQHSFCLTFRWWLLHEIVCAHRRERRREIERVLCLHYLYWRSWLNGENVQRRT